METNNNDATDKMAITINGITFTTGKAFATYREQHQFGIGDPVNVMVKQYGESAEVCPGFIIGINDFGKGRTSIDIAYLGGGFGKSMQFASVFSDECEAKSGVIGIAPINEFNDLSLRVSNMVRTVESEIASKEAELQALTKQLAFLRDVVAKQGMDGARNE